VSTPAADPAIAPDLARLRRLPFGALYGVDGLPGPLSVADGLPSTQLRVSGAQPMLFTGWAIDVASVPPRPALGVFLAIDDGPPVWVPSGELHATPAGRFSFTLAASGLHLALPAGSLPTGEHTLRVTVVTADGAAMYEESPALVFVVE
jgi:hypothetical protein